MVSSKSKELPFEMTSLLNDMDMENSSPQCSTKTKVQSHFQIVYLKQFIWIFREFFNFQ